METFSKRLGKMPSSEFRKTKVYRNQENINEEKATFKKVWQGSRKKLNNLKKKCYLGSVESEMCPYPWWMQTRKRWRVWTEKQPLEAKTDTGV